MSHTKSMWILVFGVLFSACGDDRSITPPIEEWCDIDRPREDCLFDEWININSPTPEEASVLCESPCTRLSGVTFSNPTPEVLKSLAGYEHLTLLSIGNATDSLRDLRVFSGIRSIRSLRIQRNDGLRSLDGIEDLTTADAQGDFNNNSVRILDNSNLQSIHSLNKIEAAVLTISNNRSLEKIEGFESLAGSRVTISANRSLRRISGFETLQDMSNSGIFIERNRALNTLDAFENVTHLEALRIVDNSSLSQCQAEALLEQLVDEPQLVEIEGNDPECN